MLIEEEQEAVCSKKMRSRNQQKKNPYEENGQRKPLNPPTLIEKNGDKMFHDGKSMHKYEIKGGEKGANCKRII